jgi:curved DNA-binding protein CbpA
MSAPLAGKFQDHYEILGLDPRADSEAIQRAYSKLAQKYNPRNPETGDAERFEAVNMAYETLSDPELRGVFDRLKGIGQEEGGPKFSGVEFFDALGREAVRRTAILCVLYDRRLRKPTTPSLSMRHLEVIVDATPDELSSAIWYLKQRGLAASDDKSSLQITVDGMDFLETRKPEAGEVMPFIKGAGTAAPVTSEALSKPAAAPALAALNRALAREQAATKTDLVSSPSSS